nr:hypothetical protein [Aquisphaera insulae]
MRIRVLLLLLVQTTLVLLLAAAVARRWIPLGIPGQWVWLPAPAPKTLIAPALAALAVVGYGVFAAFGLKSLTDGRRPPGRLREACWLAALLFAAIAIQAILPTGAADGFGLERWGYVNFAISSSGYHRIAREQAASDPWKFLADYPAWIRKQDTLHIGTHPPGLIALECVLLSSMQAHPGVADAVERFTPRATTMGLRLFEEATRYPLSRPDRAALYLTSLLTLLACAGTVVPLYLLGRSEIAAGPAWAAAALWPLASAPNLFQPVADTAYPFLSTLAACLAAWAARPVATLGWRGPALAVASGLVLAFGNFFTLAFLPAGLVVGLLIAAAPGVDRNRKRTLIAAVGIGFLALNALGWAITGANPIVIWWWNVQKHAGFYDQFPRTYLAWLLINPVETAVALGLPAAVWLACGLAAGRRAPRAALIAFGVLLLLNVLGRNMGEVARLWILYLPPLLLAAGAGMDRLGAGPPALAVTAALLGFQVLALQATVQFVLPIEIRSISEEHVGHPDAQLRVDQDELAAADEASVGGELDGLPAVPAELDDVAGLEVRQAAEGEVHAAELDREGDGHVQRIRLRRDRGGRGRGAGFTGHLGVHPQVQGFTGSAFALERAGESEEPSAGAGHGHGGEGEALSRAREVAGQPNLPFRALRSPGEARFGQREDAAGSESTQAQGHGHLAGPRHPLG